MKYIHNTASLYNIGHLEPVTKLLTVIVFAAAFVPDRGAGLTRRDVLFDEFMNDVVSRSWRAGHPALANMQRSANLKPNNVTTVKQPKTTSRQPLEVHHLFGDFSQTMATRPVSGPRQTTVITTPQTATPIAAPLALEIFSPKPTEESAETSREVEPTKMSPKSAQEESAEESQELEPDKQMQGAMAVELRMGEGSGMTMEPVLSGDEPSGEFLPSGEASGDVEMTLAEPDDITPAAPTSVPTTPSEATTTTEVYTTATEGYLVSTTPRETVRTSTWRLTPRPDYEAFYDMRCSAQPNPLCCRGRDDSEACSIKKQLPDNQTGICYCDEHCLTVSNDFPIPDCCPDFLEACAAPLSIDTSTLVRVPVAQKKLQKVRLMRTRARRFRKRLRLKKQLKAKLLRKYRMKHLRHGRFQKVMRAFVIGPQD